MVPAASVEVCGEILLSPSKYDYCHTGMHEAPIDACAARACRPEFKMCMKRYAQCSALTALRLPSQRQLHQVHGLNRSVPCIHDCVHRLIKHWRNRPKWHIDSVMGLARRVRVYPIKRQNAREARDVAAHLPDVRTSKELDDGGALPHPDRVRKRRSMQPGDKVGTPHKQQLITQ
eukprot:6191468-Pleurochrysis_carterae.AAC.2